MADKSTRWAFTAFENEWPLFTTMPELIAEWGWQPEECPDTGRKHYQGYLRTKRQVRFAQLKAVLPGVHLEVAKNWAALVQYCQKDSTKAGGTVHQVSASKAMSMADALTRLAAHVASIISAEYDDEIITKRYWGAVNEILKEDANAVALYTQPQYLRAWQHTYNVWLDRAAELVEYEVDRQTDRQEEYAFVEERFRFTKKTVGRSIDAPSPTEVQQAPGTPSPADGAPSHP